RLPHHARHAARLAARRPQAILEIAARVRVDAEIAGPDIGPGPAVLLRLAGLLARRPVGIRGGVEVAVVAAEAVDAELDDALAALARLLDARTLDARDAAGVLGALRHLAPEPAYGVLPRRAGIDEAPGAAARLAVAARRARGGIARPFDRAGIVAARAIESGLRGGSGRRGQQGNPHPHQCRKEPH